MKAFKTYLWLLLIGIGLSGGALSDESEETVTIRNEEGKTFYEYRVNGEVVEIKVVPKHGKPYYLIPSKNEHDNFVRRDEPRARAPWWLLFRW